MQKWLFILILIPLLLMVSNTALADKDEALYYCGDFEYVLQDDGTARITKYLGTESFVEFPSKVDGHVVTTLGGFLNESNLITNEINRAISGYTIGVFIPDTVTIIGDYAFQHCMLESIIIPDSVISIGKCAFQDNKNLIQVTLPERLRNIGAYAFYNCRNLEFCDIPRNVVDIGDYAFYGCLLREVSIPHSVETIGVHAFADNPLVSVTIGSGTKKMGTNPFIGSRLAASVLGEYSTNIYVVPDNKHFAVIDNVLFNKKEKKLVCYPYGRDETIYEIPNGIKIIGEQAFYRAFIDQIIIPASVKEIQESAFEHEDNLFFYVDENSYAHKYAMNRDIPYAFIGGPDDWL